MAAEKPAPTLADGLAFVLTPILVMALVASLVFFLIEVLYVGGATAEHPDFSGRLQWILFFFVVAAVLIARISMRGDISTRAIFYGLALGVPTYLGLQWFVEYPPGLLAAFSWGINLVLLALVWWSAHRLTWDCTRVPEDADEQTGGLLEAMTGQDHAEDGEDGAAGPKGNDPRRRKQRTPGTWVIWFSLAALPIFGLGQALIPVEDEERRRYVFWLMVLYVGSGLGLLLTTCFLGLRRYLRKRQVRMTTAMTTVWLVMGGGLIVAVLAVAALLPRPQAEYSVLEAIGLTSPQHEPSPWSILKDSPTKGEGRPGEAGKDAQQAGQTSQGQGNSRDPDAKAGTTGSKDGQGGPPPRSTQSGGNQGQNQGQKGDQSAAKSAEPQPESSHPQTSFLSLLMSLAPILKWVLFAILAVIVLIVAARGLLQMLAGFSTWAKELLAWWQSLFAGRKRAPAEAGDSEQPAEEGEGRPFAEFSDPFADGRAERWSADRLVRYSFVALQAWARDRGQERRPDETPLEFAARLGDEVPALEAEVRKLAALVARSLYARGALPATARDAVRQFWERLPRTGRETERPLSA